MLIMKKYNHWYKNVDELKTGLDTIEERIRELENVSKKILSMQRIKGTEIWKSGWDK